MQGNFSKDLVIEAGESLCLSYAPTSHWIEQWPSKYLPIKELVSTVKASY